MVIIDIPLIQKKKSFIGDGTTSTYLIEENAQDIEVIVSGIYLTENEDFSYSINTITIFEVPLIDENINIKYVI